MGRECNNLCRGLPIRCRSEGLSFSTSRTCSVTNKTMRIHDELLSRKWVQSMPEKDPKWPPEANYEIPQQKYTLTWPTPVTHQMPSPTCLEMASKIGDAPDSRTLNVESYDRPEKWSRISMWISHNFQVPKRNDIAIDRNHGAQLPHVTASHHR